MAKISDFKQITTNDKPPTKHDISFMKGLIDDVRVCREIMRRPNTDKERAALIRLNICLFRGHSKKYVEKYGTCFSKEEQVLLIESAGIPLSYQEVLKLPKGHKYRVKLANTIRWDIRRCYIK
jgi:hypothetical protein